LLKKIFYGSFKVQDITNLIKKDFGEGRWMEWRRGKKKPSGQMYRNMLKR